MAQITVEEFVNFFKYFDNKPHQVAAAKELYRYLDLISKDPESSWIKLYRNGPAETAPAPSNTVHITKQQLAAVWQCNESLIKDLEIDEMNKCLDMYEIKTAPRIRHFLSQTAHESGGGRYKKELASGEAYNNRTDLQNGPTDGPKYKGAGYIQLTGKYNYSRLSKYLNDPRVMEGVDYVAETYPFTSAGYWWMDNKMNELIDSGADVLAVTRRVNGGTNGLADRQHYYEICLKEIN